MTNTLPKFNHFDADEIVPTVKSLIAHNEKAIDALLETAEPTWEGLITPLEALEDTFDRYWSTVEHLNSVTNTKAIRDAYNSALPLVTDYATKLGQNDKLFSAIQAIYDSKAFSTLHFAQQKVIENALRDFRLSGVHLTGTEKSQYQELKQRLAKLTTQFEENLIDATDNWSHHVTDKSQLKGLPAHTITQAAQKAAEKNLTGWLLSLDFPCYYAVITHAEDRTLRQTLYKAYTTRASETGPSASKWDNSPLIVEILQTRQALANLLGFDTYAEYSLVTKMAEDKEEVFYFLNQLTEAAYDKAKKEFSELEQFAKKAGGIDKLEPWDISFYSEKQQQALFSISQEALRPYFPASTVLEGMFTIVQKLYGINIDAVATDNTWHDDVRLFSITQEGTLIGQFYLDLYAREKKRSGAWMAECHNRWVREDGSLQLPVAFLTCNFTAPTAGEEAYFTHDEVVTLFHEFGHGLHHLLTKVDYPEVSGINGVPWDAVELPSQFFENWCYECDALPLISKHKETGDSLPADIVAQLKAAKNFQAAMHMMRQIEFALFDMTLHSTETPQSPQDVQQVLNDIRARVAVVPVPEFNRFQNSFSHIFAGGYAAGYYSYKWAEVLACDAFSRFEEEGIFNPKVGKDFLRHILEMGGAKKPLECFQAFRGRAPSVEPLLVQHGLA